MKCLNLSYFWGFFAFFMGHDSVVGSIFMTLGVA